MTSLDPHPASTPAPRPVGADSTGPATGEQRGFPWARLAILVVVAGLSAMWVYAFFLAPSRSPDKVTDRAWAAKAEAVCAGSKGAIDALPSARSFKDVTPLSEALRRRADVGAQATDLLTQRVTALRVLPLVDRSSAGLIAQWLSDYDNYLADRRSQLAAWRAGRNPMFAETASDNGAPGSLRMDEFARLNAMPSCKVPQDIG